MTRRNKVPLILKLPLIHSLWHRYDGLSNPLHGGGSLTFTEQGPYYLSKWCFMTCLVWVLCKGNCPYVSHLLSTQPAQTNLPIYIKIHLFFIQLLNCMW